MGWVNNWDKKPKPFGSQTAHKKGNYHIKEDQRLTYMPITKKLTGYQTSNKAVIHHYLRSKPSVMYLILVALDVESSNLMEYPTFLPSWSLHFSATRFATVIAATLRDWVMPIHFTILTKPIIVQKLWKLCMTKLKKILLLQRIKVEKKVGEKT